MENKRNKVFFFIFLVFLVFIIVGGYYGMKYLTSDEYKTKKNTTEVETVDNRIDASKDYIYYDNEKVVLSYLEISYKDVYINLTSATNINNTLNSEETKERSSVVYLKDHPISEGTDYTSNEEGIYSLNYREYEDNAYDDYLSLIAKDFSYDVINGATAIKIQGYVFDKKNNMQLTENDLLTKYNLSLNDIKTKVRKQLNAEQTTEDGQNVIDIDGTLNNFTNYSLTISKIGKLEIDYIVKSTKQNYYDKLVLS